MPVLLPGVAVREGKSLVAIDDSTLVGFTSMRNASAKEEEEAKIIATKATFSHRFIVRTRRPLNVVLVEDRV